MKRNGVKDGAAARTLTKIRVRYAETDAMGVVYYGNYFAYFEDGRTAYLRERGLPYREMESQGVFMPVAEARCRYLAPARFEDELVLETRVGACGRAWVRFDYEVKRGSDVVAVGHTVHAARDAAGRPVRIPKEWAERLEFPTAQEKDK